MPLTPETLPRHELAGLHVRVVESTDPSRVGIEGTVVRETAGTLLIGVGEARSASENANGTDREQSGALRAPENANGAYRERDEGVRQVPKRGSTFEFAIDEAAADREAAGTASEPGEGGSAAGAPEEPGEDVAYVTVDGEALLSRPARRTENGVDSQWR